MATSFIFVLPLFIRFQRIFIIRLVRPALKLYPTKTVDNTSSPSIENILFAVNPRGLFSNY